MRICLKLFDKYLMNICNSRPNETKNEILSKIQPRNPPSQAHTSFRLNVTTINRPPSCKDSKAVVKVKRNSESSSTWRMGSSQDLVPWMDWKGVPWPDPLGTKTNHHGPINHVSVRHWNDAPRSHSNGQISNTKFDTYFLFAKKKRPPCWPQFSQNDNSWGERIWCFLTTQGGRYYRVQ